MKLRADYLQLYGDLASTDGGPYRDIESDKALESVYRQYRAH